jgi:PAS domain S-box-containing protein
MIIDSSTNVLFANPAAATLVDIEDSSACIGKNALEIIAPESREAALADFASSKAGMDGYLAQYKIITATARERWVELIGKKISFGGVPAVVVMFRDVTERKRADEALRESENRYRTLAESSTDEIFIIGRDDTIRFVNSHAAGNLHLPADEIIGKLRKNFFCLDIADTQGTYLQKVFETGKPFREEGKIRYGDREFWQDTSLVPLKDETGTVAAVIGVSRDITQRKQAEDALRESEERYRILLNEFPDPIFSFSPDGTYRHVNRAFAEGVGKSVDQIIGKKIWDVFPKDEADKRFSALRMVFSTGEGKEIKVCVPRSDGDRYYVTTIVPVKDESGSVVSAICSSKDITERKRAADTIALITRKLALTNDVTYQYIQNKVTGLMGYTKLSKDAKTDAERFTFIEKEERILADIYQLIKNTQEYQKIGLIQPRWIPVEQSLRIAVSFVDPKQGILVETALHGLELYFDPILEKIFSKLIDNAVKHGKTATRITFSCHETPDGLILICEDDGVGISPAVKARLFDWLVSEKIRFGLFFIRECLVLSGMTIAETGEPGKGARFEITVPKGAYRMKGRSE